ncbi:hypothetical protein GCM10010946_02830 [Undibacterium squillarum]|uniref:Solute-binding protein family 3/N-terminal domain-containing protein n=2 Tax=Undibacterium squillarum TaxID=1131567 RepID=A0ABQ2XSV9_9BURK|nr:hypothetical protein GCM10010946_02830 [Undibacterium squillarum]
MQWGTQAAACGPYQLAFYEFGTLYYQAENGGAGIDKDLIDELVKRSGCKLQTSVDSRVRIWSRMEAATLDMTVSGIATPEREKFAVFLPYITTRNYVLMQPEVAALIATQEAFLRDSTLMLGVVKSFRHGKYYDEVVETLRKQGRIVEASDYPTLVRIFQAKRVSAILGLPTSLAPIITGSKSLSPGQIADWSMTDDVTGSLVLSRQRMATKDIERLRQALQAIKDDGTLDQILHRHLQPEFARLVKMGPYPVTKVTVR